MNICSVTGVETMKPVRTGEIRPVRVANVLQIPMMIDANCGAMSRGLT